VQVQVLEQVLERESPDVKYLFFFAWRGEREREREREREKKRGAAARAAPAAPTVKTMEHDLTRSMRMSQAAYATGTHVPGPLHKTRSGRSLKTVFSA
jgi:hypothetical protein